MRNGERSGGGKSLRTCPHLRIELLDERAAVERIAAGVLSQPGGGPRRELTRPQRFREHDEVTARQAGDPQSGHPMISGDELSPVLAQANRFARAGREQREQRDAIRPAHRQSQHNRRRPVRPVKVIDHHHNDLSGAI